MILSHRARYLRVFDKIEPVRRSWMDVKLSGYAMFNQPCCKLDIFNGEQV